MERIRRQKTFLKAITSAANRNARKALIKHANKDQVNAVCKSVMNLLKNNVQPAGFPQPFAENIGTTITRRSARSPRSLWPRPNKTL